MKYYEDFTPTKTSFKSRIGAPTTFEAAMGHIALNFSDLEDVTRYMIAFVLGTGLKTANIMTAPLSFRQKLDVLASLVLAHGSAPPGEQIGELFQLCQRAEELRNTYFHSSYYVHKLPKVSARARERFKVSARARERFKVSARAHQGIRVHRESVNAGLLLDVADYIAYATNELENVPLMLQLADGMRWTARGFEYHKEDGSVVASFNFGEIA